MRLHKTIWTGALALILLTTGAAQAAEVYGTPTQYSRSQQFGAARQFFLTGKTALSIAGNFQTHDGATVKNALFTMSPGVGYFFSDIFFAQVGLDLGVFGSTPAATSVSVSPGLGINVVMNMISSFAPNISYIYAYTKVGDVTGSANGVRLALPFVVNLAPHFALTAGPVLNNFFDTDINNFTLSGDVGLLGYF
ncbi:MAG: hypothetical protein EOO40_08660 [Deltaproteobacteria bacterium]|nr:MAG: hypothetical protein EOO40_08660 [Deltaproteobacteria bacterium]